MQIWDVLKRKAKQKIPILRFWFYIGSMDILYELIANMSMAERSYFKRYAGKLTDNGSTNYIHLFDAIAAQSYYDESALKKKFARQKFVKQFSVAKTYLYKAIIKSLKNFNEEAGAQWQLRALQQELAVLLEKGLHAQANKVIEKGIKLSSNYELFSELDSFLNARVYLIMHGYCPVTDKDNVDAVMVKRRKVSAQMDNLLAFENLYQQQHQLNKAVYQVRDGSHLKQYELIFSNPLLDSKNKTLSVRAAYYFHFIRALHFSVTDRRIEFFGEAKQLVKVCLGHPHFTMFDVRSTMNALNLLLESAYFNADWGQMNKALQQLKQLIVKTERDKIAQFIYYSRFGLIYFDQKKDTKAKVKLIEEAWVMMQKYEQKIPYHIRVNVIVTYASAFLEMGEYSKALDWIELYRQGKKQDEARFDSQSILLMMQLIAHYELNNHLLVKNIVPNIARFIRKVGQQGNFEKALLAFFNKLTSSKLAAGKIFEETLAALNALNTGDILNRNRTMHDIFKAFIESKKAKKPYHKWLTMQGE